MNLTIKPYLKKLKHLIYDFQILFRLKYPCTFDEPKLLFRLSESLRCFITGWNRELIWCPSQLTKEVKYNNKEYTLYARWRWDDPWTGYILLKDEKTNKILWSKELLSGYNYKDYDIRKVERTLDKIFREVYVYKNISISYE